MTTLSNNVVLQTQVATRQQCVVVQQETCARFLTLQLLGMRNRTVFPACIRFVLRARANYNRVSSSQVHQRSEGYWWHAAPGLQTRKAGFLGALLISPPGKAGTPLLPKVQMNLGRLMCKASDRLLLRPPILFPISDLLREVSYGECQKAKHDHGKASGWKETDLPPAYRPHCTSSTSLLIRTTGNTSGHPATQPSQPKAVL